MPPKIIPGSYENSSVIICASPGGWGSGNEASIEVSFNGADYIPVEPTFYFYNIVRAFPRSGPADGHGRNMFHKI